MQRPDRDRRAAKRIFARILPDVPDVPDVPDLWLVICVLRVFHCATSSTCSRATGW